MNSRFWDEAVIKRVVSCESTQLKDLVKAAGYNPESFLQAADFDGIDLRFQDLKGLKLDRANFEGSIVDHTTEMDGGKIPIANRQEFHNNFKRAVEFARPWEDWKRLRQHILQIMGTSVGSVGLVSWYSIPEEEILPVSREAKSAAVFETNRGFIKRRILAIMVGSDENSLYDALHSSVSLRYPGLLDGFSSRGRPKEQLLLPLGELPTRYLGRAPKGGMARIMKLLTYADGITDVWLVADDMDEREVKQELAAIRRQTHRVHLLALIRVPDIEEPARRHFRSKLISRVLYSSDYFMTGVRGHLKWIEREMISHVRFTDLFVDKLARKYGSWPEAAPVVLRAGIRAIQNTKFIPVSVGVPALRGVMK